MTRDDLGDETVALYKRHDESIQEADIGFADKVCVSPLDRGFLYGDAVFETIRCYDSDPAFLGLHVERLNEALDALGFKESYSESEIEEVVERLTSQFRQSGDFYVRVSVTRGERVGVLAPETDRHILVGLASTLDTREYPAADIGVSDVARTGGWISRYKTHNYLPSIEARMDVDGDEALMVDSSGGVLSGTVSNVFALKNCEVSTPAGDIRLGVTREVVIDVIEDMGLELHYVDSLDLDDVDALFLTNTTWGVRSVASVDGENLDPENDIIAKASDRYMERALASMQ